MEDIEGKQSDDMKSAVLPITVVHYGAHDPREHVGGVETFARNLGFVFRDVLFMTPRRRDLSLVEREKLPVICDNQCVLDWPEHIPVIGFRHGVAAEKVGQTRSVRDFLLSRAQARAARRPNTLWVACAQWIAAAAVELYGLPECKVIYHAVDHERFNGRRDGFQADLVLHDARTPHKGEELISILARRFPSFRFEPLRCQPAQVPQRMSTGAAFLHLSRYEGNSIVCNEAMAMDLPCLFTNVGLMRDLGGPTEVWRVDRDAVFGSPKALCDDFAAFADSLSSRASHPRAWTEQHATPECNRELWREAMRDFLQLSGWALDLG